VKSISQALFWEMANWRESSSEEMPFLAWVIGCMARNQTESGNLEPAKIAPAVTEVCRRQPLHWIRRRLLSAQ
jgi:hypothetical protein